MTSIPASHEFDAEAYERSHDVSGARSSYAHFLTHCPDGQVERYRLTTPPPTVTVVVPNYNGKAYLKTTLESVRKQSFVGWECLVVDDFSKDGSIEIAKQYYRKDKRFRLIPHRANGGLGAARNSGLRSARGAYICFLDNDDLLVPSSLENRLTAIVREDDPRLGGSYSGSMTIGPDVQTPPAEQRADRMRRVDFITAAGMCPFNANQPMFKTAALRAIGGFDESLPQAEDWECWLRLLRHGYYLVPTHRADVTYRARPGSLVRSDPLSHLRVGLELYEASHATLPPSHICEGTPYVYDKPWIEYKRQLDISNRVFEFCGMAAAAGQPDLPSIDLSTEALPDFLGAIASHRDLDRLLMRGVQRQAGGGKTKRKDAKKVAGAMRSAFRDTATSRPAAEPSGTPSPYGPRPGVQRTVDVVFLPHKDYHVWSFSLILDALRDASISFAFVDLSYAYRDEGARTKMDELGLPRVSYNQLLLGELRPKMVVCMNDWDPINRRIVKAARALGIATVGVVEGIQDYLDVDTGRVRSPYQTVEHVVLPGEFDRRYFPGDPSRVHAGGVPRMDELMQEAPTPLPEKPVVVINSNFTYNVLTDERDAWVRTAVDACQAIGVEYVISRHPADKGDFSAYRVGTDSMYDLLRNGSVFVSRFSSGILESLALGRPAVYYNPHGEKVDKFKSPDGAFAIANSQAELEQALRDSIDEPARFLDHAEPYLEAHCGVRRDQPDGAIRRVGNALVSIFQSSDVPDESRRARLPALLRHEDEALLGPVVPQGDWRPKMTGDAPRVVDGAPANGHYSRDRAERWRRKVRKLQRDPKRFFEDSSLAPLRVLGRLL